MIVGRSKISPLVPISSRYPFIAESAASTTSVSKNAILLKSSFIIWFAYQRLKIEFISISEFAALRVVTL